MPTLSTTAPIVTGLGTGQYNPKIFERRNFPKNYNFIVDKPNQAVIRGGVNFDHDKNLEFARTALYPDGPVDQNNGRYVPQNILLSFISDFTDITNFKDRVPTPNQKPKR